MAVDQPPAVDRLESRDTGGTGIPGRLLSRRGGTLDYVGYSSQGSPTTSHGQRDVGPRVDPLDLPDSTTASSLLELAALVESGSLGGPAALLRLPPVLPSAAKALGRRDLEDELEARLPHLQHACHHPVKRLDRKQEMADVARARRVSDRAIGRLAAHTEDWQARRAGRVVPKRVLDERVESEIDILENRVAGQVIDRYLDYLRIRLQDIRRVLDFLDDLKRIQDSLTGRSWRLARRGWEQFAAMGSVADERRRGADLLRELEELESKLRALRGSELYAGANTRRPIPTPLPLTNLLLNDQHYRHVAALWANLSILNEQAALPPSEAAEHYRAVARAMERFVLLLLARALDHLGFELPSLPVRGAGPVAMTARPWRTTLTWTAEGELHVDLGANSQLRLVPVASKLETPAARLAAVESSQAPDRAPTIVYLSDGRIDSGAEERVEPPSWRWTRWSLPTWTTEAAPHGAVVPVSPLDVDSVERIIRTVRWALLRADLSQYPPSIRLSTSAMRCFRDSAGSSVREEGNGIALLVGRLAAGDVPGLIARATERSKQLPVNERPDVQRELSRLGASLEAAARATQPLWECPICRASGEGRVRMDVRDAGGFGCRCGNCDARWGTDQCGNCQRLYPVVRPPVEHPEIRDDLTWIDRSYGGDVAAEPCWMAPHPSRYTCPACGVCSASERDREQCVRCIQGPLTRPSESVKQSLR